MEYPVSFVTRNIILESYLFHTLRWSAIQRYVLTFLSYSFFSKRGRYGWYWSKLIRQIGSSIGTLGAILILKTNTEWLSFITLLEPSKKIKTQIQDEKRFTSELMIAIRNSEMT